MKPSHSPPKERVTKWMDFTKKAVRALSLRHPGDIRNVEAEDLARDKVIDLLMGGKCSVEDERAMKSLIYTVTRNAIIDLSRRNTSGRRSNHDPLPPDLTNPHEMGQEDRLDEEKRILLVIDHFESLEIADKNILILYLDGHSDQHIADMLGARIEWVKTRKHRAIQKLKIKIKETLSDLH